ncbi:MAG: ATP-dependent Clp protease ATP-binding subunit, partial [Verrucomicrobia bacterium]|nr:ATP-dependent Clp protease ATP-binding subunit [Verrucomicrobiota bacterium]
MFFEQRGQPGPEHFLLAMIRFDHGLWRSLQQALSIDRVAFERELSASALMMSAAERDESIRAFEQARQRSAAGRRSRLVDEWDLFAGIFQTASPAISRALEATGVSRKQVADYLASAATQASAGREEPPRRAAAAPSEQRSVAVAAGVPLLDQLGRNLTERARRGELPPVRFRDAEIREIMEALCMQRERNPVLMGEPGVGKTAVIQGVAQAILGLANSRLAKHVVYQISLGSLTAGTSKREDVQERVVGLISQCRGRPVILAVEDFDHVFGGFETGRVDPILVLMRDALLRGDIQCIGECTSARHRKWLAADTELMAVCHAVRVEELTNAQTFELLAEYASRIESFHQVEVTRDALTATVELGARYLPERRFPDKAVSVLDAAAAHASMHGTGPKQVRAEDVGEVVARLTGLDPTHLLAFRVSDLTAVESFLKARVIGQDEAIRTILDKTQIERSGLSLKPRRPDGVFLLAGPTGVGKTELAKCLSEALQGSPDKLIRFDMSEFMEKHEVAKFIGAPPGYIGHDQEAQLTKRVRANPRGVVLFDEIEKAHPDLQNIFLQIFDDGRLTDSQGQTADFSQTIILMTSNLGAREIAADVVERLSPEQRNRRLREVCERAVKGHFSPEFINRLDDVIYMNFLTP